MNTYEVIIIGAGPAGMAAAYGAYQAGMKRILLLERQAMTGGVLSQCIHDGFGLAVYEHSYTGPEYAQLWKEKIENRVRIKTNTSVIRVDYSGSPYKVYCIGGEFGYEVYACKTIIFANGCRERTIGQMRIPGGRPSGIYTAGCAQYMMNILNYKPGKSAVIFGTGDIGLIMARRLELEGIKVRMIFGDRPAGLARNYVQCVKDFNIPLKLGYTLVSVHGYKRLKGVNIAPLDSQGKPIYQQKEYIPCDTLLTAAGLIPETDLLGTDISLTEQKGIKVDGKGCTEIPGIFACGNVTKIYDLVDYVTLSGIEAGKAAAEYLGYKVPAFLPLPAAARERTFEGMDTISDSEQICILCPKGCVLQIVEKDKNIEVKGNGCKKGFDYALKEIKSPERILTTTVPVQGKDYMLLPVHTTGMIEKGKLKQAVAFLNRIKVELPVQRGQIVVKNLLGTGIDVAASKSME